MNIKEHILAGHYPLDEKGRALVPVENEFDPSKGAGWTATICATDGPGGNIVGFGKSSVREWGDDGSPFHPEGRLLPPSPRKVDITVFYALDHTSRIRPYPCRGSTEEPAKAQAWIDNGWRVVELTGSYEEPWE